MNGLWFDVGNGRYTTAHRGRSQATMLWFDVGNGRYTTPTTFNIAFRRLWFDVGNGRYTTNINSELGQIGCGLM